MLDVGESVDLVMKRGRWRSYTVFKTFYDRSLQKDLHWSMSPLANPLVDDKDPRKGLPWVNLGNGVIPAGPGGPISDSHHCFLCTSPDDGTLIWCNVCNKHMHACHFTLSGSGGARKLSTWLGSSWTCDDCEDCEST